MNPTRRQLFATTVLTGLASALPAAGAGAASARAGASKGDLAPTPSMGWNSWNWFAATTTKAQAIDNARIMAAKLLPRRDLGQLKGSLRQALPPHGSALLRLTA